MKKIFCLFLILIYIDICFGQSSTKNEKPQGCSQETMYSNPDFGEIHKLDNGNMLHICGYKTVNGFYGNLFYQLPGQIPSETKIDLGGAGEWYGLFSVRLTKFDFTNSGIKIVDLIPFDQSQYIETFERIVICKKNNCIEKKPKCIFKTQSGKIDKNSYGELRKFYNKKSITVPSGESIMAVYKNALSGHKESRNILLNTKFLQMMNQQDEVNGDDSDGSAHNVASNTLKKLVKAKCF